MVKIYTRNGDQGVTSLLSGVKVKKDNLRIEAIGQIDTLNAETGYLIDILRRKTHINTNYLEGINNLLFTIGSQLSDTKGVLKIKTVTQEDIISLEKEIDRMTERVPELKNFILPQGHPCVSWAHVVRATCRTAERRLVELQDIPEFILPYINRLSDYFFTLARYIAEDLSVHEIIWKV